VHGIRPHGGDISTVLPPVVVVPPVEPVCLGTTESSAVDISQEW
jgi:hypothetical protein